jgi:iron complex outermembrane receptor protein
VENSTLTAQGYPGGLTASYGFFDVMWGQTQNRVIDDKLHSITSAKVNIEFAPWLSLKVSGGLDYTDTEYTTQGKVSRIDPKTSSWVGGSFSDAVQRDKIEQYDAFLTFNNTYMDGKLDVGAFAGPSYKKISYDRRGVGTLGNFLYPDWWNLTNSDEWPESYDSRIASYDKAGEALASVLGQVTLAWERKYYLEFQARNDWSSTLPKQNRSYFYPGASFTWNFTEDFTIPYMNFGKWRLSWADVGRPATRYYALRSYTLNPIKGDGYEGANDITGPTDLFSGDLKPERKREIETGFDIRFLEHDRVGIDFSYYNNSFYNQIMAVPLSSATGANAIRINAGEINNQGIEVLLKGSPVLTTTMSWDVSLTFTRQWDEIKELYQGISQINVTKSGIINRSQIGRTMGELWTQDYVRDANGNKIVGDNGLYSISTAASSLIYAGNINPDFFGGFNSNFTVKGEWGVVNLSFGIDYKVGGKMLSMSNLYLKGNGLSESSLPGRPGHGGLTYTDGLGRERHDGIVLEGVMADGNGGYVPNTQVVSAFDYYDSYRLDANALRWRPDEIKDNSYVKFREIALSYTLPQQWTLPAKIQKLTVALTARNLFYIYKQIENIDPEGFLGTTSWIENSNYPTSRMFGFNVNLAF